MRGSSAKWARRFSGVPASWKGLLTIGSLGPGTCILGLRGWFVRTIGFGWGGIAHALCFSGNEGRVAPIPKTRGHSLRTCELFP